MLSLRRLPGWARALTALVVAGVVAVPLGGWDTVERGAAEVQVLEPGERHDADQFATSLEAAEVVPVEPGSALDPEPGVAYLVVRGRVENRLDATQAVTGSLLAAEVGEGGLEEADSAELVVDGSLPELSPGLPTEVAFVWQIEEGAVVAGDVVEVAVVDRTELASFVRSGSVWIDPRVGATLDLEVA